MKVLAQTAKGAYFPKENDHTPADFCVDLVAISCEEIAPDTYKYGLGIMTEIDRTQDPVKISGASATYFDDFHVNHEALFLHLGDTPLRFGFQVFPRSSVWKTGMLLTNSVGIIDEGYRGEWSAVFYHYDKSKPKYEVGDRVVQVCLAATLPINFSSAAYLNPTDRGAGGYGSTGK